MYNQPKNIQINNIDNLDEINKRIYSRNIPSQNLEPCLSFRPIDTKYQVCPVNVPLEQCKTEIGNYNDYQPSKTFYPGNSRAPTAGFLNNINNESYLRNQFFALQRCPQSYWVPDSTSELYTYNVDANIRPENVLQSHPYLFQKYNLGYFSPNPSTQKIGNSIYNNHTRHQLKNL
tara:strand:+ start:232 stop:756 length:525 start_codon:yes stop_codon:yes gene_type:complete